MRTKDKILLDALDICFNQSLAGLTFDHLEKKTKVSRGAILYHFKNKEDIYTEMFDRYFYSDFNIFYPLNSSGCSTLLEYITKKEENLKNIFNWFVENGVETNIFLGYLAILVEGNFYYSEFDDKLKTLRNEDYLQWSKIVEKAVKKEEITISSYEVQQVVNLLCSTYTGDIHLLALNNIKKKEDVLLRSTFDFYNIIIKK